MIMAATFVIDRRQFLVLQFRDIVKPTFSNPKSSIPVSKVQKSVEFHILALCPQHSVETIIYFANMICAINGLKVCCFYYNQILLQILLQDEHFVQFQGWSPIQPLAKTALGWVSRVLLKIHAPANISCHIRECWVCFLSTPT